MKVVCMHDKYKPSVYLKAFSSLLLSCLKLAVTFPVEFNIGQSMIRVQQQMVQHVGWSIFCCVLWQSLNKA